MPSTSLADLQRLINTTKEHECLEFKRATTSYDSTKLYKYCVGIANEGGGKLILGVTDKPPRQVVGSQSINDPADMQSKIFDKLGFRVNIEELIHPDGRVIICHIPSRPRGTAYDFEGAYLMRSSESLVPMSEDRLREIFAEGGSDWLNRPAREDCSSDDIVQLLDTRSYFDLTKQPIPRDQAGEIARFEGEGLIVEDYGRYAITNLGAILFAKKLDDFEELRRKAPRFIVYDGIDKVRCKRTLSEIKGMSWGSKDCWNRLVLKSRLTNSSARRFAQSFSRCFPMKPFES
jgi:ATP-dependent DNA helicase RecG